jgi:hypothetical protein
MPFGTSREEKKIFQEELCHVCQITQTSPSSKKQEDMMELATVTSA